MVDNTSNPQEGAIPHQMSHKNDDRQEIVFYFQGEITSQIIEEILATTEEKMDTFEIKTGLRKRIFNILVECLQNLYHHTTETLNLPNGANSKNATIKILANSHAFFIETDNYIRNEKIFSLQSRIDKINAMDCSELRAFYKDKLNEEKELESKGADLGMIDIARKAGTKIQYEFEKINKEASVFHMRIHIPKRKKNQ